MPKYKKEPSARLTVVVEWDHDMDIPDSGDVESILDKCREYGRVMQATFETFRLTKKELV